MQTVTFYGCSDDLIEVDGIEGADEFYANCNQPSNAEISGTFDIGGMMRVFAIYSGCWSFSVGHVAEDVAFPSWPIRITQSSECLYSVALQIDVPDEHAKLVRVDKA